MNLNSKSIIRKAEKKDCELILNFIRALADYEKLAQEVVATTAKLEKTLFSNAPCAEVLICENLEQQPVGFALFFQSYSTFLAKPGLYLEDLFILPEHRRKKHGLHLLSAVAEIALERDCGRLEWSVLNWNQPAIQFYLKLGAVPMNDWTVYRMTGEALKNLGTISSLKESVN